MAEGRGRETWAHTSLICCLLANASRDPKKRRRPYTPADFDPYARKLRRPRRTADTESLQLLREALEAQKGF